MNNLRNILEEIADTFDDAAIECNWPNLWKYAAITSAVLLLWGVALWQLHYHFPNL